MGNSQNWVTTDASFPSEHQLLNNLIPIEDAESTNIALGLGRFKVYRFRTEPYEIVMKHVRTFTPHNPKFQEYEEAARTIAGRLDHKNIAKIHSVNICKHSSICTEQVSIESYVNYYALDMQSVIDQRKSIDHRFTTGQIWYILNSLVDLSIYLQKFNIYFGIYTPRNIFLSPQGYIKVYLHHCTPKNQHSLYYHLIGNDIRQMHKFLPLPPECLPLLKKRAMSISELDLQKMDVFGIGAIVLQAMIYHPTRRYYLHQSESELSLTFDKQQLQADFDELREVYPSNLVALIQSMTKLCPEQRISLLSTQQYIKSVRQYISINGSIQLIEDQEQNSENFQQLQRSLENFDCPLQQVRVFPLENSQQGQQRQIQQLQKSLPANADESGQQERKQASNFEPNYRQDYESKEKWESRGETAVFVQVIIHNIESNGGIMEKRWKGDNFVFIMEQAYQNFNAGKYKEALNNLNNNPSNLESYEPNLAICQYMANRCQQSALNCLRKLNDLLTRKFKRDQPTHEPHTHNLIKLNIAVLLILQGRRDCALPILTDVFEHKDCFVESIQSRLLLLLMELHLQAKNPIEALRLHRYYLLKPAEHRSHSHQWTSLIIHQHGKTFAVAKEEYILMTRAYTNSALILLGAPCYYLSHQEEDDKLRQELLSRARRRKNTLSKYYEANLNLTGRFHEALRTLYNHHWQKCLALMNFTTISEDFQGLPTTKIITNVISAFVNNNAAVVHFQLKKPIIASIYLAKAKTLLSKACTGVQDKDLHLFSLNYGGHLDAITYNQALTLLSVKPKESHSYFQSLKKSGQMSRSYKFWYRMAQSAIEYSEEPCLLQSHRIPLLNSALSSLNNALLCLDHHVVPTSQQLKNLTIFVDLQEEQIEGMVMKMKTEVTKFRHSILTLICYVSLGLGLYRKVLRIGLSLLEEKKLDPQNRMNVLHYLFQAEASLGKNTLLLRRYLEQLQQEVSQERGEVKAVYSKEENQEIESSDYLSLFYHQLLRVNLWEDNVGEAASSLMYIHQQCRGLQKQSMRDAVRAVHLKYPLQKKFALSYLKNP